MAVLLVDDDEPIRHSFKEFLEREGFRVLTARNGQEALDLLRSTDTLPEVILLDLIMPVLNGPQLLTALKADERFRSIPVVLLSAWLNRWREEVEHVEHVLAKPIDTERLLRIVALYSQKSPPP